jgi:hypothetical protein
MDLIAKRVKAGVPIWTLYKDEIFDIGCMTIFVGEGVVATVELAMSDATEFRGSDVSEVLSKCRAALEEDYAEVKAESRAEAFAEAGSAAMFSGMSKEDAYDVAYLAMAAV